MSSELKSKKRPEAVLNLLKLKIDTPFGLDFKCPFWSDKVSTEDFSSIINYAEKEIIEKGLNKTDGASYSKEDQYWNKYNLFTELKDDKTIKLIIKEIKESYKVLCLQLDIKPEKNLYSNAWLNIMHKNDNLNYHNHGLHENAYLSGNLTLTDCDTTTDFLLPNWANPKEYSIHKMQNKKGWFTIFPMWVNHGVEKINEDFRLTLAFDLFGQKAVDYFWKHNSHLNSPIKRAIKI